ncbi:hypothetical protein DASC09_054810 [Saccharomycopsis crataegensis]|uniref:Helicase ATP-binding domain-containing protein n=1 Tax=Saccharomycopsis crataegensis TaxID=43959 RepID=A0AAV5QTE1_9ASCO|nr:hypothetical protein DASC09_054810 [Saccharomycopsis crataegensis]
MTYSKVYNSIKNLDSYDLIILDEAHNLKESGVRYKHIKDSIINSSFCKVLVISGTPIVDSVSEIDILLNISGERSDIIFYDNNFNTAEIEYIGTKVGDNVLFYSELKGKQLDIYNMYKKKDSIYIIERQNAISCSEKFDKNIPLYEQSSKIYELIKTLDKKPTFRF